MKSSLNIGRIFGIQFRLHYTWFAIFLLVTVSFSWQLFPAAYPDWSQFLYWSIGIATSLLFFASVLAHELAHSLVGRANDIPVKSITLFIFGGIAHMTREATKASAEFKMAAAGPACSLVIGGVFALVWFLTQDIAEPLSAMAFYLAQINALLAVFNLIPGFPLDGGRVFRSLMWRFSGNYQRSTLIATRVGQGIAYSFILGGILMVILLQEWLGGLWLVFIGWFLQNAASTSYRQTKWRQALRGLSASQVMTSEYTEVPPDITTSELVREYVLPRGYSFFIVSGEGGAKGILSLYNIKSVPQSKWDTTRVEEIMLSLDQLKPARPEDDVLSLVERMEADELNQIPVVAEGRIIGLITRDNLIRFIRARSELGMK
ncbi:MAG TPA: site-2 protease family protein [Dehalococcoidia bacterium]|nr:site-2 protease family protein [Dehalococcoidia bacterium]